MTNDPNNPEVLIAVPSDIEAATIAAALAARGIKATTTGGYTAAFRAEAPGDVNVIVRREDLDRAQQALVEIKKEISNIDWSQVNVGKPDET